MYCARATPLCAFGEGRWVYYALPAGRHGSELIENVHLFNAGTQVYTAGYCVRTMSAWVHIIRYVHFASVRMRCVCATPMCASEDGRWVYALPAGRQGSELIESVHLFDAGKFQATGALCLHFLSAYICVWIRSTAACTLRLCCLALARVYVRRCVGMRARACMQGHMGSMYLCTCSCVWAFATHTHTRRRIHTCVRAHADSLHHLNE